METLGFAYLLAIGIIFIAIEALLFSFFFFWLGLGFIVVALLSFFILFDNGFVQIALALLIALFLLLLLRKQTVTYVKRSANAKESTVHEGGLATIEAGRIKLDGTYWLCDDDLSGYNDGDKVEVIIKNNRAHITRN